MIHKMLWHTLIAAALVAALGLAHQTFGSGAGLAAWAGHRVVARHD